MKNLEINSQKKLVDCFVVASPLPRNDGVVVNSALNLMKNLDFKLNSALNLMQNSIFGLNLNANLMPNSVFELNLNINSKNKLVDCFVVASPLPRNDGVAVNSKLNSPKNTLNLKEIQ